MDNGTRKLLTSSVDELNDCYNRVDNIEFCMKEVKSQLCEKDSYFESLDNIKKIKRQMTLAINAMQAMVEEPNV